MAQAYRFIDPHALAAIADLELLARTVVDGFLFGDHDSVVPGAGVEFSQFRSYQPGDDLRRVDWKLYARSDRYYVRESDVETNVTVRFLLDSSASMDHTESGMSKFDYARYLVASLAYLAVSQGDAVALHAVSEAATVALPPRQGRQHLHRLLHQLEELEPAGAFPDWQVIEGDVTALTSRDLVVVLTDMHERNAELSTILLKLSQLKHEVMLLHLLGPVERDFSYEGLIAFQDLETGEVVEVDAGRARELYRAGMNRRIEEVKRTMQDEHVTADLVTIDQPLDHALRSYLTRRAQMPA